MKGVGAAGLRPCLGMIPNTQGCLLGKAAAATSCQELELQDPDSSKCAWLQGPASKTVILQQPNAQDVDLCVLEDTYKQII